VYPALREQQEAMAVSAGIYPQAAVPRVVA
jgi:hypothetical protein